MFTCLTALTLSLPAAPGPAEGKDPRTGSRRRRTGIFLSWRLLVDKTKSQLDSRVTQGEAGLHLSSCLQ